MKTNTKRLVMASLFAALTCVATMIIQIPTPSKGYINLGDCIVLLSGFMLGPVYGGISAGIGASLADVFSSYTIYAPATFVIKFLVAAIAGIIYRFGEKKFLKGLFAAVLGEIFMVLGYFVYECFILGGELGVMGALSGVPGNCVQGAFGIVSSLVIMSVFENTKGFKILK